MFEKAGKAITKELEKEGMTDLREMRDAMDIGLASIIPLHDGDVCRNYRWGVNGVDQKYIDEVPRIILTEYQSNSGPVLENLAYIGKAIGRAAASAGNAFNDTENADGSMSGVGRGINPYLTMYKGVCTGNVYNLPFFSDYNHTVQNSWGVGDEHKIVEKFRKGAETMASTIQVGKIEQRKVWSGAQSASYSFTFTLYNTYDVNDIAKNLLFVRTLLNNNLATRTGFATMLPPCFYKIEIPGIRYSPMAVMGGIDIRNLGQVNRTSMVLPTGGKGTDSAGVPTGQGKMRRMDVNIPDAWEISITVNELLNESRDIYGSTFMNDDFRVNVITEEEAIDGQNLNYNNVGRGGF